MAKEYIDREAVRNLLYDEDAITMEGVKIINAFPTSDVVEVVRCKDCKHLIVLNKTAIYAYCANTNTAFRPFQLDTRTHFCCYGERRNVR